MRLFAPTLRGPRTVGAARGACDARPGLQASGDASDRERLEKIFKDGLDIISVYAIL